MGIKTILLPSYRNKYKNDLKKIKLERISKKMKAAQFDPILRRELVHLFQERIQSKGMETFRSYIYRLNFRIPDEVKDEQACVKMYQTSKQWFDDQIDQFESELGIPFSEQTMDIKTDIPEVKIVQAVIRRRITEIILHIVDEK